MTDGSGEPGPVARPTGSTACVDPVQPPIGRLRPHAPDRSAEHRRDGAFAVRLGLADVSSIGTAVAERIVAEREARGPYRDMADVSRRAALDAAQLEALAAAGAFDGFGLERREALWLAGEAARGSRRVPRRDRSSWCSRRSCRC